MVVGVPSYPLVVSAEFISAYILSDSPSADAIPCNSHSAIESTTYCPWNIELDRLTR